MVLAGTAGGLRDAEIACKEDGARRFIPLKVSGPFHSPLIQDAADRLADVLAGIPFLDPVLPVYANVTGARVTSGDEARQANDAVRVGGGHEQQPEDRLARRDDGHELPLRFAGHVFLAGAVFCPCSTPGRAPWRTTTRHAAAARP